jgi:WD40 repeat protein
MTHDRDAFTPEEIDEQVDHYRYDEAETQLPRGSQAEASLQPEQRLIKDLQAYYRTEQQQDLASLERAWQQISKHLTADGTHPLSVDRPLSPDMLRSPRERTHNMLTHVPESSRKRQISRVFGLLAAVLVAALLVGGLMAALNIAHQQNTTSSPHRATKAMATSTPVQSLPIGTTVYASRPVQDSYQSVAWSFDSKRVAVLGMTLQIWDATSGHHLVTVSLPDPNEWAWTMSWSPASQELALGTNKHLLIVDGTTGTILHTFAAGVPTASIPNPSGPSLLSSQFPASGGFGYRSVAWSPDGRLLAASLSFGPRGEIQIWNTMTGAVVSTLQVNASSLPTSVAWSSDGTLLAAHVFNMQTGNTMFVAWNMATRQVIFQHTEMMVGSDTPIYWQPRSHNLAFTGTVHTGGNDVVTLKIWNTTNGKLVKQFIRKGSDTLAWSPDGKDLAYEGYTGTEKNARPAIVIIDANSGVQIYAYKGSHAPLAWSPDGKYIVSSSGGDRQMKDGQPVIKNGVVATNPAFVQVWIA